MLSGPWRQRHQREGRRAYAHRRAEASQPCWSPLRLQPGLPRWARSRGRTRRCRPRRRDRPASPQRTREPFDLRRLPRGRPQPLHRAGSARRPDLRRHGDPRQARASARRAPLARLKGSAGLAGSGGTRGTICGLVGCEHGKTRPAFRCGVSRRGSDFALQARLPRNKRGPVSSGTRSANALAVHLGPMVAALGPLAGLWGDRLDRPLPSTDQPDPPTVNLPEPGRGRGLP